MKNIIKRNKILLFLCMMMLSVSIKSEVLVKGGRDIPNRYIKLVSDASLGIKKRFLGGTGVLTVGAFALEEAIRNREEVICATFISRFEYEKIQARFLIYDIPVVYFDPSPEQQLLLAQHLLKGFEKTHKILILNSEFSQHWPPKTVPLHVEIRTKSEGGFSKILEKSYKDYIVVIPADNYLLENVFLSDLVPVLLESNAGIVSFTPNIKNAVGSVYFDETDYLSFVVQKINTDNSIFKTYPKKARYQINKKILSIIGISYNGQLKGILNDIKM